MSLQKSKPVRSTALKRSARGQDCTVRLPGCNGGGETTVLAHLPNCGRGISRKASDIDAVACCSNCHDQIDGRTPLHVEYDELWQTLMRAHSETIQRWVDEGLIAVRGAA